MDDAAKDLVGELTQDRADHRDEVERVLRDEFTVAIRRALHGPLHVAAAAVVACTACCIPLIASQAGPIADGLMALASTNSSAVPRVIGTAGH